MFSRRPHSTDTKVVHAILQPWNSRCLRGCARATDESIQHICLNNRRQYHMSTQLFYIIDTLPNGYRYLQHFIVSVTDHLAMEHSWANEIQGTHWLWTTIDVCNRVWNVWLWAKNTLRKDSRGTGVVLHVLLSNTWMWPCALWTCKDSTQMACPTTSWCSFPQAPGHL